MRRVARAFAPRRDETQRLLIDEVLNA